MSVYSHEHMERAAAHLPFQANGLKSTDLHYADWELLKFISTRQLYDKGFILGGFGSIKQRFVHM